MSSMGIGTLYTYLHIKPPFDRQHECRYPSAANSVAGLAATHAYRRYQTRICCLLKEYASYKHNRTGLAQAGRTSAAARAKCSRTPQPLHYTGSPTIQHNHKCQRTGELCTTSLTSSLRDALPVISLSSSATLTSNRSGKLCAQTTQQDTAMHQTSSHSHTHSKPPPSTHRRVVHHLLDQLLEGCFICHQPLQLSHAQVRQIWQLCARSSNAAIRAAIGERARRATAWT